MSRNQRQPRLRFLEGLNLAGIGPLDPMLADQAGSAMELTATIAEHPRRLRVYIRLVTHGGRGRRGAEYRVQLTGELPRVEDGVTTLLLGYYEPLDVFVAFDPLAHQEIGISPSVQVPLSALQAIAADGIHRFVRHRRGGNESLVGVSASRLGDYVTALIAPPELADAGVPSSVRITHAELRHQPTESTVPSADPVINIRPGVGILALFPHMNYKPWYALGEFVDNALASYQFRREDLVAVSGADYQFRVAVEVDPSDGGLVRVWDNAAGITSEDYPRAFIAAEPPPHAGGLSEFGIGMKSAACWFARNWRVTTTAINEAVERTVEFDVPRIVRDGIDELHPETAPSDARSHQTEVRLWNLYRPPHAPTVTKMRAHLASIYREFIQTGEMVLEFNGERLHYERPRILSAPRWDAEDEPRPHKEQWQKAVSFSLPSGERVEGFAALRETGSTRFAGFALFRNRRLVVGSSDETYRPPEIFGRPNSYRYQRLFGELHLDDFDITHTKDGFVWGDREQSFLAALGRHLDAEPMPLLQQAERYRSRRADAAVERAADRALEGTATAVTAAAEELGRQAIEPPVSSLPPVEFGVGAPIAQRTLDVVVRGVQWRIVIDVTNDPAQTDWLLVADRPPVARAGGGPRCLTIRVSLASAFMRRFAGATADELEPLLRLAAAMALAETTAREAGVRQAGTVLRNLNDLLTSAIARD